MISWFHDAMIKLCNIDDIDENNWFWTQYWLQDSYPRLYYYCIILTTVNEIALKMNLSFGCVGLKLDGYFSFQIPGESDTFLEKPTPSDVKDQKNMGSWFGSSGHAMSWQQETANNNEWTCWKAAWQEDETWETQDGGKRLAGFLFLGH